MKAMRPRVAGYNQSALAAARPCRPFCANAAPHYGPSLCKAPPAAAPQVRYSPQGGASPCIGCWDQGVTAVSSRHAMWWRSSAQSMHQYFGGPKDGPTQYRTFAWVTSSVPPDALRPRLPAFRHSVSLMRSWGHVPLLILMGSRPTADPYGVRTAARRPLLFTIPRGRNA